MNHALEAEQVNKVKIYREMARLKDIDIFFRDTRSAGPVILCLHGRWGRGETWVDFMQQYGDRYRIIAPDQRGHGLSGKPISKYSGEEMAKDMADLLDYLNLKSVILVGHSMGGRIAAFMAANHWQYVKAVAILDVTAEGPEKPSELPLAKLAIFDPVTKDWPMPFESLREAQECMRKFDSDISYEYFMNSLVETVEGYQMMFSAQAIAANIEYLENWFYLLPRIKCPVLLVRSSSHKAVPDADFIKMQSMISNCMAREMSHPDHSVYLSDKAEFYQYFNEFLASI